MHAPARGPLHPSVSIVTPTHRRPELLRRAVASALAQTLDDWEMVISDDARDAESLRRGLAAHSLLDPRIVVLNNRGPRGQAANMNHALRAARAPWIKPLYDDDALHPRCLERMLRAAHARPDAAIVRCLADHYTGGRLRRAERPGRRAPVEFLSPRAAHGAMFTQDEDIGTPTQVLLPRRLIEEGVLLDHPRGITSCVDAWWYVRLLDRGGLLLVNESLVDLHQGAHETVTSATTDDERYAQFELLRQWLNPRLAGGDAPTPSVAAARGMLRLIRAGRDVRSGRAASGAIRALRVHDPAAWAMFTRWAARRALPGRFERFPRLSIECAPTAAATRPAGPRLAKVDRKWGEMGATGFEPVTPAM